MKTIANILFLFGAIGFNNVRACDRTSCTPTPSHYEELGCTPILDEEKCCPVRFSCPDRYENAPNTGCQYRGQLYEVGAKIKDQFLPKRCDEECTCEHWIDENTYKISCKGISKGDLDAYDAENILEYVLDKDLDEANHIPLERCRGVAITDSDALIKRKKVKCSFEGVIYQRGERIRPDGTCFECICDESLKNTNDLDIFKPQCQRKQCAIGVSGEEHDYLNRGCVPVYHKTSTICCPDEWRCPTPTDVIKPSGLKTDSKMKCYFGDSALNLLDQVTYENGDNLNCKCYIPPMVHCLKQV